MRRAASSFSALDAAATTRAPSATATSTAANPMPPPAPRTSTHSPSLTVMRRAKREPCRAVALDERGGLAERQRVGHRVERRRRHDDLLGEGTEAGHGHDPVPDLHPGDALAHRAHDTGDLAAGHVGDGGLHLVPTLTDEPVDVVHPGGAHVHDHLARSGDRRVALLDDDVVERAQLLAHHDAHGPGHYDTGVLAPARARTTPPPRATGTSCISECKFLRIAPVVSIVEHKTGDGRVARGERTRRALAEALISLLEEGDAQPTARRIAAAGRRVAAARVPPLRRPRVDPRTTR